MSKRKISAEDKIYVVNLYLNGKESQCRIASMFDVSLASVQQWIRNYVAIGTDAFTLNKNKKYSKELKQQAVFDYLAGRGSQDDICKKYGIRSRSKLQIWIKKLRYNHFFYFSFNSISVRTPPPANVSICICPSCAATIWRTSSNPSPCRKSSLSSVLSI